MIINKKNQFICFICAIFLFSNISVAGTKSKDPIIEFTYDPMEEPGSSIISSTMTISDRDEIKNIMQIILPRRQKLAEERSMKFVTPDMDGEDRASVLLTVSLVKDENWKDFEKYTTRLLKGEVDGTGVSLVVSASKHLNPKARKDILRQAAKLIHSNMAGSSRSSIIKYVAAIPEEERHDRVNR